MISLIKERFPGKEVMIFFDEPFMVSFGSAFVSISKADVVSLMNDVLDGLDATTGVHCCGNTDWSVLFSVDTDIVNYDAFNFLDTIFYFKDELAAFLRERRHHLAWHCAFLRGCPVLFSGGARAIVAQVR